VLARARQMKSLLYREAVGLIRRRRPAGSPAGRSRDGCIGNHYRRVRCTGWLEPPMRTQNPETMTPAERDAEVASILALGLARAIHADRSRSTREASDLAKSDAERLEVPQHADLSVSARPRG
jgi:hypothetical protein